MTQRFVLERGLKLDWPTLGSHILNPERVEASPRHDILIHYVEVDNLAHNYEGEEDGTDDDQLPEFSLFVLEQSSQMRVD